MNGISIKMISHIKSELILSSLYNPRNNGAIPHSPKITTMDQALNLSPPIYPK
jgi:hypothetical protein